MADSGIVNIHGKDYVTVAKRVELAHGEDALESVETEVLNHNPVVIKAKVVIKGKIYTGISSVNLDTPREIEKQNPYEIAETSAVGRAMGFAGYGLVESIASADEMVRAGLDSPDKAGQANSSLDKDKQVQKSASEVACEVCGAPATERRGTTKGGKPYHGIFCSTEDKSHTRWLWN